MRIQEALDLLRSHFEGVKLRFAVKRLALFGSTASDEANADSDLDVLVGFEGTANSKRYFGLMFYLEVLLGKINVDTDKMDSENQPLSLALSYRLGGGFRLFRCGEVKR